MRVVVFILAGVALGAAPPAPFTAGQMEKRKRLAEASAEVSALRKQGKFTAGLPAARRALALSREVYGEHHTTTASWLAGVARREEARGESAKAAALWRQEAAVWARLHKPGHHLAVDALWLARTNEAPLLAKRDMIREATRLNVKGVALADEGKLDEAMASYLKALALRQLTVGEKHPHYANSLYNVAHLHDRLGRRAEAITGMQKALALRVELLGEDHPDVAECCLLLGRWLGEAGQADLMRAFFRRAVAARRAAGVDGQPGHAILLVRYAEAEREAGGYAKAIRLFTEARDLWARTLGERHRSTLDATWALGETYRIAGRYADALKVLAGVADARKQAVGEKHLDYATSLHSLGLLHQQAGDYAAALPLLRQALEVTGQSAGEKHPRYAATLAALGDLHMQMDDHATALPLLRRAAAIVREARGPRHPEHAMTLAALGVLLAQMGRHADALAATREALDIRKEAFGEAHPMTVNSLHSLAALHRRMGEKEKALPLFEKALGLGLRVYGRDSPYTAALLDSTGVFLIEMGDGDGALHALTLALEITAGTQGRRHPRYAHCLTNLASLHALRPRHSAALPLAEEALRVLAANHEAAAVIQSERQQLAALGRSRVALGLRLSLADEPPLSAYPHALSLKGAGFQAARLRRLYASAAGAAETAPLVARLRRVSAELAAGMLGSAGRATPAASTERLSAEKERLEAELSALSAAFRKGRRPPTPAELADALPPGVALVDYVFHTRHAARRRPVDGLTAFVLRRGRQPVRIPLGKAEAVAKAALDWRREIVARRRGREAALTMHRLIWAPLERHLGGATTVLISPDGVLGTVPFAALPGRKAGSYLIEDVALATVPVPQALPGEKPAGRLDPSLLVVGGVDYDLSAGGKAAAGGRAVPPGRPAWEALPATGPEAAAVEKSFRGLFKGGAVTALGETKATKEAVHAALGKARYAHLATHGYFAGKTVPAGDGERGWHPLLLSGVVLAGANVAPRAGAEDGILTALEVSEMDLTRLELAVLSACETGLGEVAGGEGILGMQRAFAVAGARSVVASLWGVDDRATQALMGDFYKAAWDARGPVTLAEALRRAQIAMLREGVKRGVARGTVAELEPVKDERRAPPYYWASFVLSGEWR